MAGQITGEQVTASLSTVNDPELHKDLISLGFVENIQINDRDVSFTVNLTTPACPLKDTIRRDCENALRRDIPDLGAVNIHFDAKVRGDSNIAMKMDVPFRNVIAVGAGKGGVGKSTVAVNLAVYLANSGASVGILDADIYGPNLPSFMGVVESPELSGESLKPVRKYGIEMMSMGFLIPENQALVWRGPMINSALKQLMTQVEWSELDYLVVDLPPGTGDAQMSLAHQIPVTGAVVVTTPQMVSLNDSRRGIDAFRRLDVPVLGVVENMSGDIFGTGGGEEVAREAGLNFLGRLPLDSLVALAAERGEPVMSRNSEGKESEVTRIFGEIAGRVASAISVLQAV